MTTVNRYRARTNSCPEAIEKQKIDYIKLPHRFRIKPIGDYEWVTELLIKYFSKETVTD